MQAPLEVFVHHNTLHAFEAMRFHDAIARAEQTLGARGYLPEAEYRRAFAAGRITEADLTIAVRETVGGSLPGLAPALPDASELARRILVHGIDELSASALRWELAEHRAATRFAADVPSVTRERIIRGTVAWLGGELDADPRRALERLAGTGTADQVAAAFEDRFGRPASADSVRALLRRKPDEVATACLWEAARDACRRALPAPDEGSTAAAALLPRDAIRRVAAEDPDDLVHPVLVPLAAAFLDRGQSHWSMPDRESGFFVASRRVLGAGHAVRPAWQRDVGAVLRAWDRAEATPESVIQEVLEEVGIAEHERSRFVEDTLQRLPGFAGRFRRLEAAPAAAGRSAPRARLVDFLAVRLTFDRLALQEAGRRIGFEGRLCDLRAYCAERPPIEVPEVQAEHRLAWPLFLVLQHAGVGAPGARAFSEAETDALLQLIEALDPATRRRIWHEAYERHYRDRLLGALDARRHAEHAAPSPRAHVLTCLDERMESLRRHAEEVAAETSTYGVAGFFNLAIAYQGIDDPSTFPLCPVVLTPHHRIAEEPHSDHASLAEARRRRRQSLTAMSHGFERASRSMLWGIVVTMLAGAAAALPLLATVFAPWLAGRLRQKVARWVVPSPLTRLAGTRSNVDDTQSVSLGFSPAEKADRVGSLLLSVGLTSGLGRLVVLLGHGSKSTNNPHFAAYSCGACGGRSGGPNARLFAQIANDREVRALLAERGMTIPETTWFVGGELDTCADTVRFFDLDDVPPRFMGELEAIEGVLGEALRRQAHERCRKFASAPHGPSTRESLRHVEERSFDLSQARPELGHASNAGCVVGRRALTRGLFLDRRVFLASYDPTQDEGGAILERTLMAVVPVCAGINLEYYFSTTDNERLGAGTKLPHNVTGLVGVMNGASSDLRTGLPRQMIELHEPIRLQLVVEAHPRTLLALLTRQPQLGELVRNEWITLSAIDPDDGSLSVYQPAHGFVRWEAPNVPLPSVGSSADWYRGHEGLLPPALVQAEGVPLEEVGGVV